MKPSLVLPTTPLEHEALDYAFLRQEGIRHIARMAGDLWTDYNAHDPGITLLEQLCYALTDLAYRIDYDLPDLLTREGEETYDSLYSPAQILTSHPVTLTDLRKLVLDAEGVKNAWIEKVEAPDVRLHLDAEKKSLRFDAAKRELQLQKETDRTEPVTLKGLYRILIEKSDLLDSHDTSIKQEVARRLHANRNLCEDFEEIKILEPQLIQVHADIEIGAVENPEDLLLEICQRISEYISPSVPSHSLSELLAAGTPVDKIFDGPLLRRGFIDSEELRRMQRKTALRTSDLISEIMDVPGIRAVRNISLSTGVQKEPWSLDLTDASKTPKLDLKASVRSINLERGPLRASINVEQVIDTYYDKLKRSGTFRELDLRERDLKPPGGRDRKVGNYYSIQHQLPDAYGIGDVGLPDFATPLCKAQAKQLKAYLLFFDQLLANYFTQLAHVRELFSFHSETPYSYFSQMIDDPRLGLDEIRTKSASAHETMLQRITENPYVGTQSGAAQLDWRRKNRFLNHLLARFAERFTDYSLILYGLMPEGDVPGTTKDRRTQEKLARDKQIFLRHYPRISSARGTALNYLAPWDTANVSGLEERIRLKLGLADEKEAFYMVEHILLRPMEGDEEQGVPLLEVAEGRPKDPYSLQLSFVFSDRDDRFKRFAERTIREETPAHLTPYIHWLDPSAMRTFAGAYKDWLAKRRDYWKDKLSL